MYTVAFGCSVLPYIAVPGNGYSDDILHSGLGCFYDEYDSAQLGLD